MRFSFLFCVSHRIQWTVPLFREREVVFLPSIKFYSPVGSEAAIMSISSWRCHFYGSRFLKPLLFLFTAHRPSFQSIVTLRLTVARIGIQINYLRLKLVGKMQSHYSTILQNNGFRVLNKCYSFIVLFSPSLSVFHRLKQFH